MQKLPKYYTAKTMKKFYTADGVLIEAGSAIYVPCPMISHCERVKLVDEDGPLSAYAGTVFPNGRIVPGKVYSTQAAAKEAYKKFGQPDNLDFEMDHLQKFVIPLKEGLHEKQQ